MSADYNPTMLNQDCSKKLFNWFLSRVDILTRLKKAVKQNDQK